MSTNRILLLMKTPACTARRVTRRWIAIQSVFLRLSGGLLVAKTILTPQPAPLEPLGTEMPAEHYAKAIALADSIRTGSFSNADEAL